MKKILYYVRIILFIIHLILSFLLINKLFYSTHFATIYFICNLLYSFLQIITILSKKKSFKTTVPYNLINIAIFGYTIILYRITSTVSRIDIITNRIYLQNNYILLIVAIIGLTAVTFILNQEENEIIK